MSILLVLCDVLRDDLARCALLVGLHVPHQLFILLGTYSFTAGER
jgi:hypothetical protein